MVFINVMCRDPIVLDCHRGSVDGEAFRLVIDPETKEILEAPERPCIDASAAYSRVFGLLMEGQPLPDEMAAEWG